MRIIIGSDIVPTKPILIYLVMGTQDLIEKAYEYIESAEGTFN